MSKKSRAKRKLLRDKEKRNRKAAMRAQYEAWRDQGINHKSKRARANAAVTFRQRKKPKVRTKLMSNVLRAGLQSKQNPKYLTVKQVSNTMSFKKFLKLLQE